MKMLMKMKNPAHPGLVLKTMCLGPLGLTITEAAKVLDMPRAALSEIVNERRGISPQVALRIEKAFNSQAGFWLRMQSTYDLAHTDPQCTARVQVVQQPAELTESHA